MRCKQKSVHSSPFHVWLGTMHLSLHSFTEFPFLKSSYYHSSERLLLPKTILFFCGLVQTLSISRFKLKHNTRRLCGRIYFDLCIRKIILLTGDVYVDASSNCSPLDFWCSGENGSLMDGVHNWLHPLRALLIFFTTRTDGGAWWIKYPFSL